MTQAQPVAASCGGRRALGVSRVLEIDTASGPKFGHQQYKDHDFLRDREVVLTFDDGPLRPHTKAVLEALAAHCTKATFFMVGKMALADPEMVKEVARRGHTIGTHTFSHANLRAIGASRAQVELERGFSAVKRAAGQPIAPFFRFPFLADSQAMIAHAGHRNFGVFSIDVDAIDYRAREGSTVHRNVMVALTPQRKGIILFHDIQPSTAQGLLTVLDDLAAKGYKVVHLVPKTAATTLAQTDAAVEQEATGRARAVAANPMVQRSVTWPMGTPSGAPAATGSVDTFAAKPAQLPGYAQPPVYATPYNAGPAALPPAAAAQPAAPILRGSRDDDWRQRVFNN